jgi:hypothetical protein
MMLRLLRLSLGRCTFALQHTEDKFMLFSMSYEHGLSVEVTHSLFVVPACCAASASKPSPAPSPGPGASPGPPAAVQCLSAPESVPVAPGAIFFTEAWIGECGLKMESETCTVVDSACSAGGTITAKCVKGANGAGFWTDVQGACKAPTSKLYVTLCYSCLL